MAKKAVVKVEENKKLNLLMDHYTKGVQQMDTRRTRKPGGWNDVINSYMGKLPANWPYISQFTDPIVRTTILEKTSRLLNSKLRGRLAPREGGDVIKAKINNALLDFQWDNATEGGPMLEKVAKSDQTTRMFGASFALVYWDNKRDTNEIKVLDPRDVFTDFSSIHVRGSKWIQIREFTTVDNLEAQGMVVAQLKDMIKSGATDYRSTAYQSQVLANRGLQDLAGQDLSNPVVEVVTEWTPEKRIIFAPRYGLILKEGDNPYDHKKIPVAMLRYYPLPDDIYGESEIEPVLPLSKVINSALCAFFDEMSMAMRPPVKIVSGQVRMETIEYGPGARWIMNNANAVTEAQLGGSAVQAFTNVYPALKAAFNTAMGDQSLGMSSVKPFGAGDKTATEVVSLERQQNNRDQYNQLYLGEFLKDIMMMWLSNNQQYLLDDPNKEYYVLKIIGKDMIQDFQSMKLDDMDIPSDALKEIAQTLQENPNMSDQNLMDMASELAVPVNPVITNPQEKNPANYEITKKMDVKENGVEADLHITRDDLKGVYDYIPDVTSMAVGASQQQQNARSKAYQMILGNPQVMAELKTQGQEVDIKRLLSNILEDAGEKDANGLFKQSTPPTPPNNQGGPTATGSVPMASGVGSISNVSDNSQAVSPQFSSGELSQPTGL